MSKKILLCAIFFFFSPVVLLGFLFSGNLMTRVNVLGTTSVKDISLAQTMADLSSQSTGEIFVSVKNESSTAVMIENYLKHFNSPLLPYVDSFLMSSEKYGVDPKLIVAIAQQESNLGKSSPEDCYNAWGWGIHARGTTCFSDWNEAIETVTKGIAKNYCAKGLCGDPCEMMKKYTPKSNGSWCFGVKQFLNEMETGIF